MLTSLSVKIRNAGIEDKLLLAKLGRETYFDAFLDYPEDEITRDDLEYFVNEAFSVVAMESELQDQAVVLLIAEEGDEAIGYAKLIRDKTDKEIDSNSPIMLDRMYVAQHCHGKGVGKALMKACLAEAMALGHDLIWLAVGLKNTKARKFYEAWGFEPLSFTRSYSFGTKELKAEIMRLKLEKEAVKIV